MGWWPCPDCCGGGGHSCANCNGGSGPSSVSVSVSGISNNTCSYCSSWNGTYVLSPGVFNCLYTTCVSLSSPYCSGGLSGTATVIYVDLVISSSNIQVNFEPRRTCLSPFPFNSTRTVWNDSSFSGDCSPGASYTPTRTTGPSTNFCDYSSATMTVNF